jgi:hypothetical protein
VPFVHCVQAFPLKIRGNILQHLRHENARL